MKNEKFSHDPSVYIPAMIWHSPTRKPCLELRTKDQLKTPFIKGERLVSPREDSVLLKSIFISHFPLPSLFPFEAADLLAIPFFSLFIHLCFVLASTSLLFRLSLRLTRSFGYRLDT